MTYLDDLLASTHRRLEEVRARISPEVLEERLASAPEPRGFALSLEQAEGVAVIAEIKRRSPSRGPLALKVNASELAASFAAGGASALSVVTEPDHFEGSLEDLAAARSAGLPVLRKDFVLDEIQVMETRAVGADAVLLIVRILGERLVELAAAARALRLDALVEVFDEEDMRRASDCGASLIGINHRDLTTFEVDPHRTARLAPLAPDGATIVGLSGVSGRDDVEALAGAGARAVLVGESLITADDPAAALRVLRGVA